MLVLTALHKILAQVLVPPHLHTAVLLTPAGHLVSYACGPSRTKDDIRVVIGLCGELWLETGVQEGIGMVESEVCTTSSMVSWYA